MFDYGFCSCVCLTWIRLPLTDPARNLVFLCLVTHHFWCCDSQVQYCRIITTAATNNLGHFLGGQVNMTPFINNLGIKWVTRAKFLLKFVCLLIKSHVPSSAQWYMQRLLSTGIYGAPFTNPLLQSSIVNNSLSEEISNRGNMNNHTQISVFWMN